MAQFFLLLDENPDEAPWTRSGDMECEACGRHYREHVGHPHAPWLTVLCDGRRVKL